jgi:UDP-N-acetylmuramate: L-alanyl-gamma-D-glutamyl-meso-diaminopimelate ligase
MGSLAGFLKARGVEVTGTDTGLYPPMSTALERWQIPIFEGFRAENLEGVDADLYVIGNAVRPDNPEAVAAIASGVPYRSFSDALYEIAMADKHSVVVSGTHGKTTTTNLVAALLNRCGQDPSLLVGGISLDFDGSFRDGAGPHFVVEGDEYDTAFFDKTPKFLHYHPQTLILTSVEFDHADIYRDLDHVKSAFRSLVAGMPSDGVIVAAALHEGVRDVLRDAPCRVVTYGAIDGPDDDATLLDGSATLLDGSATSLDWCATSLEATNSGTRFVLSAGDERIDVEVPLHGAFNVENAVAALCAVATLGVPVASAVSALPEVEGVKRRQEVRGEARGVTVIDDFAHHPTAVRGSIEALKARYPEGRIIAIFEPRTNTSRRKIFQEAYAQAFDAASRALVFEVPDEPIYSATGDVTELFSARELCGALEARGVAAHAFASIDEIVASAVADAQAGDVFLVMSNGPFGGIWELLLRALRAS